MIRWEEKSGQGNGQLVGDTFDGYSTDPGDARGVNVHVAELFLVDDGWRFGQRVLGPISPSQCWPPREWEYPHELIPLWQAMLLLPDDLAVRVRDATAAELSTERARARGIRKRISHLKSDLNAVSSGLIGSQ